MTSVLGSRHSRGKRRRPVRTLDEAERVPRRISEHPRAAKLGGTQCKDIWCRLVDVFDHHVQVHLLWHIRARPRRGPMVGGQLEREARGPVSGGDDGELVAVVRDRLIQQGGVEARQRSGIRTVDDQVVESSAHQPMLAQTGSRHTDCSRRQAVRQQRPDAGVHGFAGRPLGRQDGGAANGTRTRPFGSRTTGPSVAARTSRPAPCSMTSTVGAVVGGIGAATSRSVCLARMRPVGVGTSRQVLNEIAGAVAPAVISM